MNERIKQLAEQAGSTHKQNLGVYQFFPDELQEFADSIIRECAKIADSADESACEWIGGNILTHFGVK